MFFYVVNITNLSMHPTTKINRTESPDDTITEWSLTVTIPAKNSNIVKLG